MFLVGIQENSGIEMRILLTSLNQDGGVGFSQAMKPIKQQRREYRNGLSWGDFVLGLPVLSRALKEYRKGTSEGEL